MTHKQLPKKHFLALFITTIAILFYVKIVFDITPPPTAYILIALPFLGFAIYYFWDGGAELLKKYKIHLIVVLVAGFIYSNIDFGPTLCECAQYDSNTAVWGNKLADENPNNPQSGKLKDDYKMVKKCADKFDGYNNINRRAKSECNN